MTIIEDRHSCPQFEEQMGDIIRYSNLLTLEIVLNNETLSVLTDRDFFGEISLFTEQKRRTAAVISQSYRDLYRLDRELMEEVLKRYPKIAEHIKNISDERVAQNKGLFKKDE